MCASLNTTLSQSVNTTTMCSKPSTSSCTVLFIYKNERGLATACWITATGEGGSEGKEVMSEGSPPVCPGCREVRCCVPLPWSHTRSIPLLLGLEHSVLRFVTNYVLVENVHIQLGKNYPFKLNINVIPCSKIQGKFKCNDLNKLI